MQTEAKSTLNIIASAPSHCPLCHHSQLIFFHQDKKRSFYQCNNCQLVSVPQSLFLTPDEEKAVYDLHDNTNADEGYRRFLSRTLSPVLNRVSKEAKGLDYGCGEGAVLSQIAAEQGINVANYDLYYHNNNEVLAAQYDFITMTEVIEHISDAKQIFQQLDGLLKTGGILAIMTKRVKSQQAFENWHYKHDPTHINFYSIATFEWLAKTYQWQLEIIDNDVVFFHKAKG